jgi:saccharopine dehydrogenase-like NADP-dependent oxidoreductase
MGVCVPLGITDISKFEWLGLFDGTTKLGLKNATAAQILEKLLLDKWVLEPQDKDMLVMVHQFTYMRDGEQRFIESSMVNLGDDQEHTAMSKTVGYPVGICAKLILNNQISERGVLLPTKPEIYNPILDELEELGIAFQELEKVV